MVADRFTKTLLLVIAVCLVVLCTKDLFAPAHTVHGASTDLQFSADKDHFYFFEPTTGRVYTYLVPGGHLQGAVQLTRPGGELRPTPTY